MAMPSSTACGNASSSRPRNRRHHESDRSRHVVAVATELVPRRKAARPEIHPYSRERSGGRHRYPVLGSRGRECDRNGMRRSLELPLPGVERAGSGGRVGGMVGDVVGDAAERVGGVDRPPPAWRQPLACQIEGPGVEAGDRRTQAPINRIACHRGQRRVRFRAGKALLGRIAPDEPGASGGRKTGCARGHGSP